MSSSHDHDSPVPRDTEDVDKGEVLDITYENVQDLNTSSVAENIAQVGFDVEGEREPGSTRQRVSWTCF